MQYTRKKYLRFKQHIGKNIHLYRKYGHVSQEELAHSTSLKCSHIDDIEQGKGHLNICNMLRIACALDVEPFMFFDDAYAKDKDGSHTCISHFTICDDMLTDDEALEVYNQMITSGKYTPPHQRL